MPRLRNIERSVLLQCWLPETLHARLALQAYSPMHGKIPPRGLMTIVTAALELYFDVADGRKIITLKETPNVQS